MLHIPKHLQLPHFQHSQQLALSPIVSEEDELLRAIEDGHEEPWQLDPTPDATELGEFWDGVQQDLRNDPTWFDFADDEE